MIFTVIKHNFSKNAGIGFSHYHMCLNNMTSVMFIEYLVLIPFKYQKYMFTDSFVIRISIESTFKCWNWPAAYHSWLLNSQLCGIWGITYLITTWIFSVSDLWTLQEAQIRHAKPINFSLKIHSELILKCYFWPRLRK